ncbi:Rho GTPase-activating protein [Spatholobus suberectus]|nr:Rho GTPase-activating protein [Spatholobus suberectus]
MQDQVTADCFPLSLILFLASASMPSIMSPQWQDKAAGFFSSSGVKLKEAKESAGTFVGEVTKDTKSNVTEVAGRVGSMVKSRWAILQQPSTRHAVQDRLISAAATTGTLLRRGFSGTKDKVAVGKSKVEEVAKITAQKSKTILTDIERWQKGVASTDVFGVPIEVTVQRQDCSKPIPQILVNCADYLIVSGLNSPYLFKSEGDMKVIHQLVSLYNQDSTASVPEGTNPVDVAAVAKYYLASLPEPLTTLELYNEIISARSSIYSMRNILKKLSSVNYMTLEFITALLLRVSQKSLLNKMDARSLAMEMAPVIMWQKERRPEFYRQYWNQMSKNPSKMSVDPPPGSYTAWDMLADDGEAIDASSPIPLDDGTPVDFGAIEVVQLLIEHHNAIFTDANETVWK